MDKISKIYTRNLTRHFYLSNQNSHRIFYAIEHTACYHGTSNVSQGYN